MEDKREQTKQLILIEIENARLWGSIMLPLIPAFLSVVFTSQLTIVSTVVIVSILGMLLAVVLLAAYFRKFHIRRARKLILEL